ncbi:MarR family transcriptional regulator [Amnibacterium sp. CER49]|uniref:MarR family winged helix-turn-helix transcriptional regulator n=1 Tax=Amnibacterium sp. CER49 TaxID=3039161 RepID=UPI00244CE895|nr:MarR family transcriptional regulator [Amnibacterium sp. CER49]MDH2443385.1 MarR family transcriptional regulator [Amnibacterium sp. CER49]
MALEDVPLADGDARVRPLADAIRLFDYEYRQFRMRVAASQGLSIPEFDAFTIVTFSSAPITPKRLAEDLRMTTGAVTAMVDRLVGNGLFVRRPHPTDRRSVHVELTPAGQEIVENIYRGFVRAFSPFAGLSDDHLDRLVADVVAVTEAVRVGDQQLDPAR